jgi:hypothetical protein
MLKIVKQSKRWFYIPFAIFRIKNQRQIVNWVTEPNNYHEALKRNSLMEYIVWLNFLYLIILFKLILIFVP